MLCYILSGDRFQVKKKKMMMLLFSILWYATMAVASVVVPFTSEEGGTFPRQVQQKPVGVLTAMEAVPSSSEGATKRKMQGQTNLRLKKNENSNLQKLDRIKQNEADIQVLTTVLTTANIKGLFAMNTAGATANTNIATLTKDLTASNTALTAAKAKIDANNEALDVVNALNAKLVAALTSSLRQEDQDLLKTAVRVNLNLRERTKH
jgi:hypothetical protein